LHYQPSKKQKDLTEINDEPYDKQLKTNKDFSQKEIIRKALETTKYNKSKAAKILGISRTTLWSKLKELNL
jgi:transcriptional regulator with PAS, ATPase and Fis domain